MTYKELMNTISELAKDHPDMLNQPVMVFNETTDKFSKVNYLDMTLHLYHKLPPRSFYLEFKQPLAKMKGIEI
jgi:hypothetical protein